MTFQQYRTKANNRRALAPACAADRAAGYGTIAEIRKNGTTVLLVEQNACTALEIAARGDVLKTGARMVQGRPEKSMRSPEDACEDLAEATRIGMA